MRGSLTVGRVEVRTICEGYAPLPLADEAPGQRVDWAAERRRYPWAFADDELWAWHVHAFLLRTPQGEVLVDTGVGAFGPWAPWADVTDQSWSDVDQRNVRHVVLTHLHADHAGGTVLGDGTPRFPNARYHVHPADWTYFDERPMVRPSDGGRYDARSAMDRLATTGALSLDAEDHEVSAGVRVLHTPGHTPGHRSVLVEDAAAGTLLLTGDLLHVPVQVAHPEWPSSHDEDPPTGAASRTVVIGRARELGWHVGVSLRTSVRPCFKGRLDRRARSASVTPEEARDFVARHHRRVPFRERSDGLSASDTRDRSERRLESPMGSFPLRGLSPKRMGSTLVSGPARWHVRGHASIPHNVRSAHEAGL